MHAILKAGTSSPYLSLKGQTETVDLLLSSGADVNAKENSGKLRQVIANIINHLKSVTNMLFKLKRPLAKKKIIFGLSIQIFQTVIFIILSFIVLSLKIPDQIQQV